MCLGLVTLGDANIRRVLDDPPLVWQVVAPDDPDAYEEARSQQGKGSLLSRLLGRRRSAEVAELAMATGEGITTDLDKAWHGIHYLLTGTAWEGAPPHNFLLCGGREIPGTDLGYGPARVLMADETREASVALDALGDDELRSRFDPTAMVAMKIYPDIWTRPPEEDDTLGYLVEYVQTLRGFLHQAVDARVGLVLFLS
jgi:hypothetical protein